MTIVFTVWLVTLIGGQALWLWALLRRAQDNVESIALRYSALATLPGLLPIVEFVARRVLGVPTSGYWVRWPFLIGSLLGLLFLIASYLELPLRGPARMPILARLVHVVAWTTGIVVAVALVLDV